MGVHSEIKRKKKREIRDYKKEMEIKRKKKRNKVERQKSKQKIEGERYDVPNFTHNDFIRSALVRWPMEFSHFL